MYPAHLSYLKEKGTTWFNPAYGVVGFWEYYRKIAAKLGSAQNVWAHRDLKRAKEIYAISVVALTMAKQDQRKWWITKPKEDPPDGIMGTIIEENGIPKMHLREVEVVEHIQGNVLDTIRTKLSKKQYEPNTVLVCYVSQGGTFDFEKESAIISKEITSLDHIFLVFMGTKLSEIPADAQGDDLLRATFKVSCVQIKPVYSFSSIDILEDSKDFRANKEGAFFIYRGMGKGTMTPITLTNPPKLFENETNNMITHIPAEEQKEKSSMPVSVVADSGVSSGSISKQKRHPKKRRKKDYKKYLKRRAEKALRRKRKKKQRAKKPRLLLTPRDRGSQTEKPVPANFSLVNNTEEVIAYFKDVARTFANREQVAFDLENVEQLTPDAIALLIAKVKDINFTRGLNMSGNAPLNPDLKKLFDDSNFLDHVSHSYHHPKNEKNLLIHQQTHKKVHPEIAKQVAEMAVSHTFKDARKFQPIFKMMIECMANTDNHANLRAEGIHDWWLFTYCDPNTNITSFSFLDLGIGIFNSNPVNTYKERLLKAVEEITDLTIRNNPKLVPKLFSGEIYTSRTKDKTRGQGLPTLKECSENPHIRNFTIITNNVKISLPSLVTVELQNKFNGTFLYWELHP